MKGKVIFENGSEWFIEKPKGVEESVKAGERALLRAVSEGMSKEDTLEVQDKLLEKGVPLETVKWLMESQ